MNILEFEDEMLIPNWLAFVCGKAFHLKDRTTDKGVPCEGVVVP